MVAALNMFAWITSAVVFLAVHAPIIFSTSALNSEIEGIVVDKKSGEPLPMVHVYLSHTTSGTVTDGNGLFRFSTGLTGSFELVFSYIGYKTNIQELLLSHFDNNYHFEIELQPESIELEELEVRASNREWQEHFREFSHHFLGTTRYASESEIRNPWVIDFWRNEGGGLCAVSNEPITVVNHALGYEIHIDLVEFSWDRSGKTGFYKFYSMFTEIQPENNRQRRTWERARERAYRGSFEHFLKSLYNQSLSGSRFKVLESETGIPVHIDELSLSDIRRMGGTRIRSVNDGLKGYRITVPVYVIYKRGVGTSADREVSRIVAMQASGLFLITPSGRLFDPASLRLDGAWSNHRVGNLLPDDYSLRD